MKDRSELFMMIERKIQKKAKACFEKEDADKICAYSDKMIQATRNGEAANEEDCDESLLILKELM